MGVFQVFLEALCLMFYNKVPTTKSDHLANLKKNYDKDQLKIDAMAAEAIEYGACCPSCKFGDTYRNLIDKQERRRWEASRYGILLTYEPYPPWKP